MATSFPCCYPLFLIYVTRNYLNRYIITLKDNKCQDKVIVMYNFIMIVIKLRELLWDIGISGKELHLATGVSQAKISEIIRGKRTNIPLETVEKICLFLGCEIQDLIEIKKV